jgi:DNA-binding transcriptional MerR regulator
MKPLLTIDELTRAAGEALTASPYNGQPSARVREVPDKRTIRYYTTIGLLDRPAEMRGRTAYYGRRHLLQLVAIKRRQAQGRSLAQIQQELAGATDKALARWADLPDDFLKRLESGLGDSVAIERRRFWTTEPRASARAASVLGSKTGLGAGELRTELRIPLGKDVALVFRPAPDNPLTGEQIEKVRASARRLLHTLHELGLTSDGVSPPDERTSPNAKERS